MLVNKILMTGMKVSKLLREGLGRGKLEVEN